MVIETRQAHASTCRHGRLTDGRGDECGLGEDARQHGEGRDGHAHAGEDHERRQRHVGVLGVLAYKAQHAALSQAHGQTHSTDAARL